jgi:hypothetical protein
MKVQYNASAKKTSVLSDTGVLAFLLVNNTSKFYMDCQTHLTENIH